MKEKEENFLKSHRGGKESEEKLLKSLKEKTSRETQRPLNKGSGLAEN